MSEGRSLALATGNDQAVYNFELTTHGVQMSACRARDNLVYPALTCATQQLGNAEVEDGGLVLAVLNGHVLGRKPENGGNSYGHASGDVMLTETATDVHAVAVPCGAGLPPGLDAPAGLREPEGDAAGRGQRAEAPDVDNALKLILDALTACGRFWADDGQVAELTVVKRHAHAAEPVCEQAHVTIWVTPLWEGLRAVPGEECQQGDKHED